MEVWGGGLKLENLATTGDDEQAEKRRKIREDIRKLKFDGMRRSSIDYAVRSGPQNRWRFHRTKSFMEKAVDCDLSKSTSE